MFKKIFLVIQLFIYISFIYLDITKQSSDLIKYLGIIINFFYALVLYLKNKKYDLLVLIALFFTLIADYFLLVINDHYLIGILCFCIVQTIYGYKLSETRSFIYRISIFVIISLSLPLFKVEQTIVNIVSIYSFVNLTINVIAALDNKDKQFFIALLLFWLCDLNVGIYNIPIRPLNKLAAYLMWIFYFPSQVIITLKGENKHEKI